MLFAVSLITTSGAEVLAGGFVGNGTVGLHMALQLMRVQTNFPLFEVVGGLGASTNTLNRVPMLVFAVSIFLVVDGLVALGRAALDGIALFFTLLLVRHEFMVYGNLDEVVQGLAFRFEISGWIAIRLLIRGVLLWDEFSHVTRIAVRALVEGVQVGDVLVASKSVFEVGKFISRWSVRIVVSR